MNTAFSTHQRHYDSRMPPEDDTERLDELLARVRSNCDSIEWAARRPNKYLDVIARSVADAISALQDIPTQEPI